ncbi:hypothetical protein FB451DRAFT_1191942 [Mycena latifolia]|nr:hypothetical protein FB451DRAFT_1191942 [Mycena latifolia]
MTLKKHEKWNGRGDVTAMLLASREVGRTVWRRATADMAWGRLTKANGLRRASLQRIIGGGVRLRNGRYALAVGAAAVERGVGDGFVLEEGGREIAGEMGGVKESSYGPQKGLEGCWPVATSIIRAAAVSAAWLDERQLCVHRDVHGVDWRRFCTDSSGSSVWTGTRRTVDNVGFCAGIKPRGLDRTIPAAVGGEKVEAAGSESPEQRVGS